MLQNIRDNAQGLIAKFLVGMIAVGFVFFGVDFLGVAKAPPKAQVNDVEISEGEFRAAMERQKAQIASRLGDRFDPSMLQDDQLAGPVLDGLVQQALLAHSNWPEPAMKSCYTKKTTVSAAFFVMAFLILKWRNI